MPMDSSYYQFVLSPLLDGCWGKACDDFFKKVLKAKSKGNESMSRFIFIELTQITGSPVLAAVYKNRLLPR
jgi:hypothetical protein